LWLILAEALGNEKEFLIAIRPGDTTEVELDSLEAGVAEVLAMTPGESKTSA